MNPQELRIGNFVSKTIQGYTTFCIVDYLDLSKETFKDEFEYLEPIPLTEEWLIKFGFEKITNGWIQNRNPKGLGFALIIDHERGLVPSSVGNIISWRVVNYIHQLQNLYFALTGEELEIKEIMK